MLSFDSGLRLCAIQHSSFDLGLRLVIQHPVMGLCSAHRQLAVLRHAQPLAASPPRAAPPRTRAEEPDAAAQHKQQ